METVVDRAKRLRAQDTQTQFDMDDMAEGMLHRASKSPSDSTAGAGSGTIATPSSSGMQEATALAAGTDIAAAVRTRCLTEGVSNGLQPVIVLLCAPMERVIVCLLQHTGILDVLSHITHTYFALL
jgi:hypothetical protein